MCRANVLEIGIGAGQRSMLLSKYFKSYEGLEPDEKLYEKFNSLCEHHKCNIICHNKDLRSHIESCKKKYLDSIKKDDMFRYFLLKIN